MSRFGPSAPARTATPEIAVDAHKIIRAEVAKLLGADVAANHPHSLRRQREAGQRPA
jgi:hypothetical protein